MVEDRPARHLMSDYRESGSAAAQYRREAVRVREAAGKIVDEQIQSIFLNIAAQYERLAQNVEQWEPAPAQTAR